MKMVPVAFPNVGALPILVCESFATFGGAAGTVILVPDIFVLVVVPGALVERDLLAGGDVAPRNQRHLVAEPRIRIAGVIEVLIQTRLGIVLAQRQIDVLADLPDRAHAIDIGLEIVGRDDLAAEFHQPLARGDRLRRDHAIAVDLRLSRYELGADPGAGEIGFHESLYGVNRRPISSVHAIREGDETGSRPPVP